MANSNFSVDDKLSGAGALCLRVHAEAYARMCIYIRDCVWVCVQFCRTQVSKYFKGKDDNDLVIFVAPANSYVPGTWEISTAVC